MKEKNNYLDSVANAFAEAKGWRATTFILAGLLGVSIVGHIYQSVSTPSYIVPHHIASAKGPVKVKPGSSVNLDYLQYVAIADLELALNWTKANVDKQFARFLNRCTPSLYASQHMKLNVDAEKNKKEDVSQSFYPNKVTYMGDNTLAVAGTLVRWVGGQEMLREDFVYFVYYKESGGLVFIDNLEIKKNLGEAK